MALLFGALTRTFLLSHLGAIGHRYAPLHNAINVSGDRTTMPTHGANSARCPGAPVA